MIIFCKISLDKFLYYLKTTFKIPNFYKSVFILTFDAQNAFY